MATLEGEGVAMTINRPRLWGSETHSSSTGILSLPTAVSSASLYGEVDLRDEFDRLIFGTDGKIQHGHWVAVRHMRRESDGSATECVCRDSISKDPDPDCSYCLGEGFLWDEEWYIAYSMYSGSDGGLGSRGTWMPPGQVRVDYLIFFFRYDVPLIYGDKIVQMKLDTEGDPVVPYVREAIHKPHTINTYRSDGGRIEYIATYCREEDAIRPDTL